jgi:hypothetical protein
MEKQDQKFYKNCGEILRMALTVESSLDFFISNYFVSPQSRKTFFFEDLFLIGPPAVGFERKIQIFEKICKEEGIKKERIDKIIKSTNFIKNIRNAVSHDEAFMSDVMEGIKLQKRKSEKHKKDELKITDELVKEINEERLSSIQEIYKINGELSDPLREKHELW